MNPFANKSWAITGIPQEAVTFSATDFGGYTARGYDPSAISGSVSGVPIAMLTEGEWLKCARMGSSGTTFKFFDKDCRLLGAMYACSMDTLVMTSLLRLGADPAMRFKAVESPRQVT